MTRKYLVCAIIVCVFVNAALAQQDLYAGGNGSIINQYIDGEHRILIRKHIQEIELSSYRYFDFKPKGIYDKPREGNGSLVSSLLPSDHIISSELLSDYNPKMDEFWLKIITKSGKDGWIQLYHEDPYGYGAWEMIGKAVDNTGKEWTIRKLHQGISTYGKVMVLDKPGHGSVVGVIGEERNIVCYKTIAITEEEDIIDGERERWVQIKINSLKKGWVWGKHIDVERGGPKYSIPDDIVMMIFGL